MNNECTAGGLHRQSRMPSLAQHRLELTYIKRSLKGEGERKGSIVKLFWQVLTVALTLDTH